MGEQPPAVVSKYLAILFIAGFAVAMYLAWTRNLGSQGRRLFGAVAMALCFVAFLSWLVPDERRGGTAARWEYAGYRADYGRTIAQDNLETSFRADA